MRRGYIWKHSLWSTPAGVSSGVSSQWDDLLQLILCNSNYLEDLFEWHWNRVHRHFSTFDVSLYTENSVMLFNHLFRYFHCSHDFLHVQSSDAFYNHPFMWQVFSRTILTTPPGRNSELKNFNDSRLPQHSNSRTGSSSTEFSHPKGVGYSSHSSTEIDLFTFH